jgi:flagellar basal body P-ring formation protein FlgA
MSRIRPALAAQFEAMAARRASTVAAVNKLLALLPCALFVGFSHARADDGALAQRAQALAAEAAARAAPGLRVQVQVGRLDPRLKLASCNTVTPYLPPGTRLWGSARIGLRCTDGPVRWNVFLPITVDVYGPGLVAAGALPAGATLGAADVQTREVQLSAAPAPALKVDEAVIGRTLARPLAAGEALRRGDLRARQWFAAGDTVRIVAGGAGWRIDGEGQALNAGVEGQIVRVRTESGRVVSGLAVAERQVEVAL